MNSSLCARWHAWAAVAAMLVALTALGGCASLSGDAPPDRGQKAARADGDADRADASSGAESPKPDVDVDLPKFDLNREILFRLLAAEVAVQRGQIGAAAATYLSLARSTRDPRLARRATELALADRSTGNALESAQLWYELSPKNPTAVSTIEALWLSTGRFEQAEPLVRERLRTARAQRKLPEIYQQLARTLARSTDRAAALAMLERLAEPDARVPEAHLAMAAIASAGELHDRAAAESAEALALRPDDERIAMATASYVQKTKLGNTGALKVLEGFLERRPKASDARVGYARLLAADGKPDAARAQMVLALERDPDNPAILFGLGSLAYQLKQPEAAGDYLRRYVELPAAVQRDNVPAYLFLAQIAEDGKRIDEAIGWLARVTRGEQFLVALTRRALLMGRQGRIDEARELLRGTSVPNTRERVQLTAAEAQLLREAKRNKEAFETLAQALERTPTNVELLYDHAMAAERLGDLNTMETSLRKVIALRPDHAHAHNALGYSLADHNQRLDEAYGLIEKALELAPGDAHIVDSMGWVLFRQGKLDQAIEWLRKAYQMKPEAEIAAHLGEALWKAGRAAEAREMWLAARKLDPDNETLKETLARLNVSM